MRSLKSELLAHRLLNRRVANDGLLGSADRPVVKTLARQNILHGFRNVSSALDAHRHVAWSNSKRRLARRIRRAHKSDTAGRENHGRLLVRSEERRGGEECRSRW